jgi:cellulase
MAKVSDATTAVGSSAGWFKVFADTWAKNTAGASGDDDFWGTKDLNTCCGKSSPMVTPFCHQACSTTYLELFQETNEISITGRMNVKIPSDIAPGDYLCKYFDKYQQLSEKLEHLLIISFILLISA